MRAGPGGPACAALQPRLGTLPWGTRWGLRGPILPAASARIGQAQPPLGRGFGRPPLFLLLSRATGHFLLLDVTWDIRELGESAVPAGPVFQTTAEATLKPLPFRGPEPLTPVGRRWGFSFLTAPLAGRKGAPRRVRAARTRAWGELDIQQSVEMVLTKKSQLRRVIGFQVNC